jgi:hypothetical protein
VERRSIECSIFLAMAHTSKQQGCAVRTTRGEQGYSGSIVRQREKRSERPSTLMQQSARHSLQHGGAYEKENMITT